MGLLLCGSLTACANRSGAAGKDGYKIAMSSNSMTAAPVLAALSRNTFSAHGITVKPVAMNGSSSNSLAALLSGDTQFAFLGGTNAVDARAQGSPVVIVGATATNLLTMSVSKKVADSLAERGVRPDSPIADRVKALKGLTIATSPPGSLSHTILLGMLKAFGVSQTAVKVVPSDPGAMTAGIKRGLYDAVFWPVGVMEPSYADGTAKLFISFPAGDVPQIPSFMQGVVITTERVVKSNPDAVKKVRDALIDAGNLIRQDEKTAKTAVKNYAFESVDQASFDQQWAIAKRAWLTDLKVPRTLYDSHMKVQALVGDAHYDKVTYDGLVLPAARS
ncbi:ABC transporter substrate-binding protein [Actinomadura physcomitrii]|uniref:ABC transporter substrate-binding protein n=1 Tax=Actinomadura physcomitrii TaxID=2650748 RepID=UPI001367C78B|nr:ABC transporter substrate-binding protein [Actinomadura physcomitrii]